VCQLLSNKVKAALVCLGVWVVCLVSYKIGIDEDKFADFQCFSIIILHFITVILTIVAYVLLSFDLEVEKQSLLVAQITENFQFKKIMNEAEAAIVLMDRGIVSFSNKVADDLFFESAPQQLILGQKMFFPFGSLSGC